MRSFIAIDIPAKEKSTLARIQEELKGCGADVRWVNPDNLHLTMKFLGDIKDNDIDRILEILRGVCNQYSTFRFQIRGIDTFPNRRSPRVLWVGVSSNNTLARLQADIEEGMASIGFKREEREFSPHLTIGRFRSPVGKEGLLDRIKAHENNDFGSVEVKAIYLMRSDLSPEGARYTRIAEINLGRTRS